MPRSNIREVVLVPNRHWGGEGLLGCVFGYTIRTLPAMRELTVVVIALVCYTGYHLYLKTESPGRYLSSSYNHLRNLRATICSSPQT